VKIRSFIGFFAFFGYIEILGVFGVFLELSGIFLERKFRVLRIKFMF
jgi:hypothetical protein